MLQRKLAATILLCTGLLASCSKRGNDGPASPPPPPVDSCLLDKKIIAMNIDNIAVEYSYPAGSTNGKFTKVVITEKNSDETKVNSRTYEYTSNGFICKWYTGEIDDGNLTTIDTVTLNDKMRPVKLISNYLEIQVKVEYAYVYNDKDELQAIKSINTPGANEIWFEWANGNPVKHVQFISSTAMVTTQNEYSDKPVVPNFRVWQTADLDMSAVYDISSFSVVSSIYDTYYFSLALKRKNYLKKQEVASPTLGINTIYNYSDYTTDAKGKLSGCKIEKTAENVTQKGTAEIKVKCP